MTLAASGWVPAAVAALSAILVAVAGGVLTTIGPWYEHLRRPSWNPPNWVFGPVWTTIFTLAAISGVMAWTADEAASARTALVVAYVVNGALNIAWSALFFRMRRPDWALAEVVMLWLSIAVLIAVSAKASPVSALLLLPYLVWVGIAAFLNLTIVRMNPPFRGA